MKKQVYLIQKHFLNHLPQKNSFSLIHKNIFSLYANSANLEILINNLERNFSIIGLSETWTFKQETKLNKIQMKKRSRPYIL